MLANKQRNRGWLVLLGLLVGAGGTAAQSGSAQQASDGGYAVSESGEVKVPDAVPPAGTQENLGPVRLARFSYIQGNVTWRTDENTDWSSATLNLPLRQGAQIWVTEGGRAEIQFDDGSVLRLGTGAVVTLQTLYSDADGEFTELKMTEGLGSLRLRHDRGIYQVNTPLGSVKAAGPAAMRVGVGDGLEIALTSGKATLEGGQGTADLVGGDFLDLRTSASPYTVRDIPRPDSWDRWNQERDELLARDDSQPAQEHLPADVAIVAGDLNSYGSWRNDSEDGWVWCPRVSTPDWRPYRDGHWTWVNPFGWTWVSSEAWGWAPYHYGTWVSRPYGWAWCPGPVNQYWSPAVVHFSECNGQIAWCPLAPAEVRYPAVIAFGFRRGNWSTYFSIGGAAVYYPTESGYCAPRLYDTRYVNRVTYVTKVTTATNLSNIGPSYSRFGMSQEAFAANNNTYLNGGRAFIPINSRTAAGVTAVASGDFGGRSTYISVAKADTSLFARGRVIGAPMPGRAPVAGPIIVKPTPQATTPTRTFTSASQAGSARQQEPVFRAPLKAAIVQNSAPITPAGRVIAPTSNGIANPGIGTNTTRPGYYQDRSRTSADPKAGSSAAGAAAQARSSLGIPSRNRSNGDTGDAANGYGTRTRSNSGSGDSTTGNGNRPTGGSSSGNGAYDRTPRYNGSSNNGSNPNGSGNPGSGTYDRTPRYNGTGNNGGNSGSSSGDRAPRYSGPTGNGNNSSSGGQSSPSYTPRPTQPNQPTPPTRTDPPRQTPPAPTRTDPPANKGSDSSKDSGKDSGSKGSDPTNRGRGH